MLGLKLNHVSKGGPWWKSIEYFISYILVLFHFINRQSISSLFLLNELIIRHVYVTLACRPSWHDMNFGEFDKSWRCVSGTSDYHFMVFLIRLLHISSSVDYMIFALSSHDTVWRRQKICWKHDTFICSCALRTVWKPNHMYLGGTKHGIRPNATGQQGVTYCYLYMRKMA